MKSSKFLMFLMGVGIMSLSSCQTEEVEESSEVELQGLEITQEVVSKVKALNFNPKEIEVGEIMLPNGSKQQVFLLEGDIAMSPEELTKMAPLDITSKQYRTYNLVQAPRTIDVIGFMGGSQALTAKQQEALENAISEYNSLDLSLNFTLRFGLDYQTADIVVFQNPNGEVGGVAGFPGNGDPYQFVQIFSGMEDYSLGVNQHVIIHEIGHTLGLRHTDWFTRQSCGRPSFGELAHPSGAVHIPGTPRRYDPTSVMLSCFSIAEDGEFGPYDIVALEYLY
ncbi:M57 family metalloprotease [Salinimicrobium sp. GXAS 041]|uniref:M57 family metalloprotease n=1 Tax=Salinimicrobium sp. GXAS 041 TaxID=3400806 RepID=UPI003C7492E3